MYNLYCGCLGEAKNLIITRDRLELGQTWSQIILPPFDVMWNGFRLATINNLSQIGQSLGYNMGKINTLVSLWSIWNFLGRFGAGYISDILLRQKGWTRPLMIAITLATMTVGHFIISLGFAGNLYVGSFLVGICYGAQWSLKPTVTAEIFGALHMGTIFNTIGAASPMGTYILSARVIGHIYDKEAGDDNSCSGVHFFMSSFLILAFGFLGFLVALTLFFRTRALFKSVVLRRLFFEFVKLECINQLLFYLIRKGVSVWILFCNICF